MIRTRTLGGAVIEIGDRRITPTSELMFGVAVFLSSQAGQRVSRGGLIDMFWPTSDALAARHSLRQMLYRLRQLGFALEEADDGVRVQAEHVLCDFTSVLTNSWPESADSEDVATLGDFLAGFNPDISDHFHDWLDAQRSALQRQRRRAALRLLGDARKEARWLDVDRWGRLVLESDPMSEEATLACAESAAMMGSKLVALEILDRYVDELGERASTLALPAQLLRRRISERSNDWGLRSSADVRLVGRASEMRRLTDAIDSARVGLGQALLVVGAPGIGKTRLCAEARAYAVLGGFRVLAVAADPSHSGRPLALVTKLAELLYELPGVAASPPAAMSILRTVAQTRDIPLPFDALTGSNLSLAQIAWALTEAAQAASHESAVLILLDDLHNADPGSASVLESVAMGISRARVALVATARSHWAQSESISRTGWQHIARVHIQPLPFESSRVLASLLCIAMGNYLSDDAVATIASHGGGNPLFLHELASHRVAGRNAGSRPLTLARMIEQRIAQLTPRECTILRVVVLLGALATLPRLRLLLRGSDSILACEIEPLETDGLLHLDDSGVLTLHECWRDAIESGMARATKCALALECATVLRDGSDASATLDVCWHAAHLFCVGGDATLARQCYMEAGERMLAIGVPSQSRYAFSLACDNSRDPSALLHSLTMLASAEHASLAFSEATSTCRRALQMPIVESDSHLSTRATLLAILADSEWKAHNAGTEVLSRLAAIVVNPELPARERNLGCLFGIRISFCHNGELAKHFRDAVIVRGESVTEDWIALTARLIFEAEQGSAQTVRDLANLLGQRDLNQLPPHARVLLLRHRSMALRFVGDHVEALNLAKEAVALAQASGLPDAVIVCLSMAFAHMDYLEIPLAEEWLARAQELAHEVNYDERQRAFRHALGRLYISTGRSGDCVALCMPALESLLQDPTVHRKAVEAASFAHAAAAEGETGLANRLIDAARPIVESLNPGFQLDYAADSLACALQLLGREQESSSLVADYLSRRQRAFPRPIVPAHAALRSLDGSDEVCAPTRRRQRSRNPD